MSGLLNPPSPVPDGLKEAIEAAGHYAITEPDGWLVDDLSAVSALIASYQGSTAELQWWKAQQLAALAAQYETVISAGRLYSVTGGVDASQHSYQIDEVPPFDPLTGRPTRRDSQSTITTMGSWARNVLDAVADVAPWPDNFAWSDTSNNLVSMTAQQCWNFSQNIAAYVNSVVGNYFGLRAAINTAATLADVQAININQGWPSNA